MRHSARSGAFAYGYFIQLAAHCIMKTNPPDNQVAKQHAALDQERERLHRRILNPVAHDLKTPLACIIGSLEIYQRSKEKLSPLNQENLLATALQEAYRLDDLISNILDMARFEANAAPAVKKSCEMNQLVEDSRTSLGHRLNHCELNIKTVPGGFTVTTDPELLVRAIACILDNAAKYGPARPVIGIAYETASEQVVIRIQDNGPGIPESKLEEIFSKYTRFIPPGHPFAGTGLGLPICREIMRLLGGTVTAANLADGKGAVFTLAFAA